MTEAPIGAMRLFLQKWELEKEAALIRHSEHYTAQTERVSFATAETERAFALLMQEMAVFFGSGLV